MNADFRQSIKNYPEPLFYNSEGNKTAYQLCVRHLSAATSSGLSTFEKGYVIPKDALHIVNFETESIEIVSEPIKLIKLKTLA